MKNSLHLLFCFGLLLPLHAQSKFPGRVGAPAPAIAPAVSGEAEPEAVPPDNTPVLRKTYGGWLTDYFTSAVLNDPTKEATVWGRNADPDGDGTRNQMEYFVGTSPTVATAPPAVALSFIIIDGNTYGVVSFPRRKLLSDPNFQVQFLTTNNLAATPFAPASAQFLSATTPVDPGNAFEIASYRLLAPVTNQTAFFVRLQITALLTDSDGDGLADALENGSHVNNGPGNPGTNSNQADTDGDGIKDGDENLGTLAGLNLPQMGCNPLQRNILLEYHWFDDSLDCAAHSHRPSQAALDRVSAAFASGSGTNPDGTAGIVLIHDRGDGGVFNAGSLISNQNSAANLTGGVSGAQFQSYKNASFPANRNGYFHYVLMPHRYNINSSSSGQAELNGDDLIVSLYCSGSDRNVSNTIMHELGHNLNLRHGGNVECNYKPNYNSVMNYRFQFPGVNDGCGIVGTSLLDYSRGTRITLNENSLNENAGVCGSAPLDFNSNGTIESNIAFDVNASDTTEATNCGGTLTTLTDWDDWGHIVFTGLSDSDRLNAPIEIIDCDNPPLR